ncbi:MAG: recombination mediator RecR [Culturomica sp.]|jgi:recombination protein RecR|nr:recombination mediator RecR [Culturomica sp.]
MSYSTKLLDKAVEQFASLPGIGKKTAMKFVLSILKRSTDEVNAFINSINELKNIKECKVCHNIADEDLCEICKNRRRDDSMICVVENIRDLMAIEATAQFKGLYHVLGGVISPMDGVGPSELNIGDLIERTQKGEIKEVIFALSATIEGDTTAYYIYKKIKSNDGLIISTIAKGIAVGNDLEYTDALTLGRSISNRISFTE